jgi:hypothetical protein
MKNFSMAKNAQLSMVDIPANAMSFHFVSKRAYRRQQSMENLDATRV